MGEVAVIKPEQGSALPVQRSTEEVVGQVALIQDVMKKVMKEHEHYGVIPGTSGKPSLLKSGAEKLSHTFMLAPSYAVQRYELPRDHREYEVLCEVKSISTGHFLGSGVGNCSTMESKYRFRKASQKCPQCGKETIIKGKKQYGGGWLCWEKKGGCGAKFQDGDPQIENQNMGRVEHDNPADYYNTVLKMAKKRAFVDAVLTVTAASDIFTQDVEDLKANGVVDAEFTERPQGQQARPQQGQNKGGNGSGRPAQNRPAQGKSNQGPPPDGDWKNHAATQGQKNKMFAMAGNHFGKERGDQAVRGLLKHYNENVTKGEASRFIERFENGDYSDLEAYLQGDSGGGDWFGQDQGAPPQDGPPPEAYDNDIPF